MSPEEPLRGDEDAPAAGPPEPERAGRPRSQGEPRSEPERAGRSPSQGELRNEPEPAGRPRSPGALEVLRSAWPALALAGGLGALGVARERFQHRRTFRPRRYPVGSWDPIEADLPAEDVYFPSEDGVRLHGWWMPHPRSRGALVYCHGRTGSIGERFEVYRQLRRLELDLFVFDYRGYGRSDGRPHERGLYRDGRAAVDHVVAERGVALERIVLLGHSLGGAVAIETALHRAVAGLVVESSFTDVREMARHLFPGLPLHRLVRNGFRNLDKVARLAMPKLFVHGSVDRTVPLPVADRLYAAAAEPKARFVVDGGGHEDVAGRGGRRYVRELTRFRDRCLPG